MDWGLLFSTFGLVFVAELGDKTQLAVVTQTCKYRLGLPVFLGGSLALTAVTGLGVAAGQLLGGLVPELAIRIVASATFVIMGLLIWREARASDGALAGEACACPVVGDEPRRRAWSWRAFGSTLSLLFLAELGDKTQLAVLGLTFKEASPWAIFAGGALALTGVTALGVLGGQQLSRLIPERVLLRISAVAFVVIGVLMGLGVV
ncbi:MAG: TMEM165/GDT1 family protein [Anaerolineae bacterium]|nr:TMEM165/GDT1 family protein [Anaerolineae bacterium]